ncbi:MAG: hypothetical protein C0593_08290 [Marinilabiliales bacterium]|nr:MAG: hypothetical protein C0593_08290 [Marinilabiliales bacterium]
MKMIIPFNKKRFSDLIAVIAVLLIIPGFVSAQEPDPYSEEVTIIAPYQPSVEDANKLNIEPQFESPQIDKPQITYGILSSRVPTRYTPGSLRPASITGEPISKLYRNYIKGGFGNYWTPYLELYAGSLRHKKNTFSVGMKHHSSNGSIKNYGPSQFSQNSIDINTGRVMKKYIFSASLGYDRDVYHNYGYMPLDSTQEYDKDSIKQRFQTLSAGIMFKSRESRKSKGKHYFGLNYNLWNSRYDLTEHDVNLKTGFIRYTEVVNVLDSEEFGVDVDAHYYNEQYDSVNNHAIISALPYLKIGMKEYTLKLGAGLHQLIADENIFYVSPEIELQINVIPDAMKLYAGVTGGVKKNTLAALSAQNPFITPGLRSSVTTMPYKAYGGVNGKIGSNMDLNVNFEAGAMDNMPFFVNVPWQFDTSTIADNAFDVVFDDVTFYHVHASFLYRFSEVVNGRLYGDYYAYTMTTLQEPFHTPEMIAGFELKYNFMDKIAANVDLFYCGNQYSASLDPKTMVLTTAGYEIDPYMDISIGANYRFSKPLSFFLNVNNILNNHYEYRYGYPAQGINFLVGASYAF